MHENTQLYRMTLCIHGRVHGVFFRESTCEAANTVGLVGRVDNNPDGTVVIIAEGTKEKLKKLLEWSNRGPELAKVEKIEETWQEINSLSFTAFGCPFH